jgi:hypothetical protein
MPALFRRSSREDEARASAEASQGLSESMASLIASHVDANAAGRGQISHRQFREYVRDRARSQDEVLNAIHVVANSSRSTERKR